MGGISSDDFKKYGTLTKGDVAGGYGSGLGPMAGITGGINSNPDPLDMFGLGAAEESADLARSIAAQQLAENQRQFDLGFSQQQPFFQEAVPAFGQQAALAGAQGSEAQQLAFQNMQNDPMTQHMMQQGLGALSPSETGGAGSERMKALTEFSRGLAMQDMEDRFNRLGIVSGAGQTAGAFQAGLGQDFAQSQANALQGQQIGVTNALSAGQAGRANMAGTAAGIAGMFAGNRNQQPQVNSTPPPSNTVLSGTRGMQVA